jgi:N-acetylmuramoyl-L-alanine amidase
VFLLGSILRAQAPSPETIVPAAPVEPALPSASPPLPYGVIVIDPGHGGEDVGTRGAAGTEEKTLTLAIAQRVKTLVETRLGTRVVLTRSDDRRVGFDERAAIANNSRAGLFLSLHLNSSPNPASAGAEVIHLRQGQIGGGRGRAGDDEAVALPAPGGTTRTVELIRWETAQARHLNASAAFAETLEAQLRTRVTMSSRPALDLPLRVLPSLNMPAVVLEMAYLSNAGDEGLVQSGAFQDNIALAIHDSIVQFSSYIEEQEGR